MTQILGIDLFDRNPEPDWADLYRKGCRLVYLKASEGLDVQKTLAPRARRARDEGWLVGGYSYLYAPRENQAEAAEKFAALLLDAGAVDLRPVVDVESHCSASRAVCESPAVTLERLESFVIALEGAIGTECAIYTYPSFWAGLGLAGSLSRLCRRVLWIADYRPKQSNPWAPTGAPEIPKGWAKERLALWQYDDTTIDKNLVIGDGLELLRWPERHKPIVSAMPDMWQSGRDAVANAEAERDESLRNRDE